MRTVRLVGEWSRPEPDAGVRRGVEAILAEVREGGDAALLRLRERLDGAPPDAALAVGRDEIEAAVRAAERGLVDGLRTTAANVRAVVEAQLAGPVSVELREGQRVEVVEAPVRRAGLYVPGGRAAYPSTLAMLAVTARAAGVGEVAACVPPGPDGRPHPATLAACGICEVAEVHCVGGAHAIAALAQGTESVRPVDVVAGPGGAWVQEAKRQLYGSVGVDGIQGPSELAVLCTEGADAELLALDLLAQAEHGEDSPLWALSPSPGMLDALGDAVARLAPNRPSAADAELQLILTADAGEALRLAEEIAPEHLQLAGGEAEALAGRVRAAGCVLVGGGAGTAFCDYVAGSNHVLPTGGAARFQSAISASTFRRRMARVSLPGEAPARLAPAGAAVARAEGFPVHAESMERRA